MWFEEKTNVVAFCSASFGGIKGSLLEFMQRHGSSPFRVAFAFSHVCWMVECGAILLLELDRDYNGVDRDFVVRTSRVIVL